MATFYANGKRWKAELAQIKPMLGSLTLTELSTDLELYADVVDKACVGEIQCTKQDLVELSAILDAFYFEAKWRTFCRHVGIYMEVR